MSFELGAWSSPYIAFNDTDDEEDRVETYISCVDPTARRQCVYKIPERLHRLPAVGETEIKHIQVNSLRVASCFCLFVSKPRIQSKEVSYYQVAAFAGDNLLTIRYVLEKKDAGHAKSIECEYMQAGDDEPFELSRVSINGHDVFEQDDQFGPMIVV